MKDAARQYKEQQILNASPAEGIVLLYDGAIRFLTAAAKAIDENNIQERFNNNKRALEIISYLLETLNAEAGGEVGASLQRAYVYMLMRLSDVDVKNSKEAAEEVVSLLKPLRESWQKIAQGQAGEQEVDGKKPQMGQNTYSEPSNEEEEYQAPRSAVV